MTASRIDREDLRKQAEAYLRRHSRSQPEAAAQDASRLIHELQVHQAELEMQYEELQRTQIELKASRDWYADLYATVPIGCLTLDRQGTIRELNPAAAALLYRSQPELLGKRLQLFLPQGQRKKFTDFCRSVETDVATCVIDLVADLDREASTPLPVDRTILLEGVSSQSDYGLVRIAMVDLTDRIQAERRLQQQETELRHSHQKIQETNAHSLQVQEETRRGIARELHDDCCQRLALMAMTARMLERGAADPLAGRLRALAEHLKDLLGTVRHIAYGLHPAMWEMKDVAAAMRDYAREFTAVTELPVEFEARDIPAILPQHIAACLFRTFQECLQNVIKYAAASQVHVRVERRGDRLISTISDNGKGFDLNDPATSTGLGLVSIRERVQLLHGELNITSGPGDGTTVQVVLPLEPPVKAC